MYFCVNRGEHLIGGVGLFERGGLNREFTVVLLPQKGPHDGLFHPRGISRSQEESSLDC